MVEGGAGGREGHGLRQRAGQGEGQGSEAKGRQWGKRTGQDKGWSSAEGREGGQGSGFRTLHR